MLKRSASASPEPQSNEPCKQPRITLGESTENSGLRTPAPSVPPSQINTELILSQPESVSSEPLDDPHFIAVFENVSRVAGKIVEVLEKCPASSTPGTNLSEIFSTAKELQNIQLNTSYVIGLVGDAGQGKSSTVNALLDKQDLASNGDAGLSVTSFVTEFREKEVDQEAEFLLKAQLLSRKDIEDLIRELLMKALFSLPSNPDYEERQKELSEEEFRKLEEESSNALDTLYKIFSGESMKHVEQCTFKQGYFNRLVNKLYQSFGQVEWPGDSNEGVWSCSARTLEECRGFTTEVMEHRLAPFVKVMQVYLHSTVLASGVVIADIPGFRDTNGLRVRTALRYTAQCDGLLVVNNISRIASNMTVLETIRNFRRLRPAGLVKGYSPTIAVIATKASTIDNPTKASNEYKIDEFEFKKALGYYNDTKRKSTVEHLWARYYLENLHITQRNALVARALIAQDSASTSDIPLKVFCIDNQDFFNEGISKAFDTACKERSKVFELQKYCAALPSRQRFKAMDNIVKNRLAIPIQSLAYWMKAGQEAAGYKEALDIGQFEADLLESLSNAREMSSRVCINAILLLNPQKNELRKQASRLVITWTDLHYRTIKAFCVRGGKFRPRDGDERDWNEELIKLLNETIQARWPVAEQNATIRFDDLKVDVATIINSLSAKAKDAGYPPGLIGNLQLKQNDLYYHIDTIIPELKKQLDILYACLTEHGADSYVAEYMTNPYQMCATEYGKGAKKACTDILNKATQGKSITTMALSRITAHFVKEVEGLYDRLEDSVKVVIQRLAVELQSEVDKVGQSIESGDILGKYPQFGKQVEDLLDYAERQLQRNDELAQHARAMARERGYID